MKRFTCRELGGACDEVFEGETQMEIVSKCKDHAMASTDDAHKEKMEEMKNSSDEDRNKWMKWLNSEWEKREDV